MAAGLKTETMPPQDTQSGGQALSAPMLPQAQPALAASGGAPAAPQGMPSAPPTHEQTVAALRHFDAIKREIGLVLKNPALGKSDVKSQIIDGVTRLVAEGFMPATAAVDELSKVPSNPLQQMHWAQAQMANARNAENTILDHYGA